MLLKEKFMHLGVTDGYKPIEIGFQEMELLTYLTNFLSSNISPNFKTINSRESYLKIAESIMKEKFTLQKILCCSEQAVELLGLDFSKEDFIRILKRIDPYELPIKNVSNLEMVELDGVTTDDQDLRSNHAYINVCLPSSNTPLIGTIYNHEIMHSQVTNGGKTKNYQNTEVLSMFMEDLTALDLDNSCSVYHFLKRAGLKQLYLYFQHILSLRYSTSLEEIIATSAYITSELKCNHLFSLYINGNENQKQHIIALIQSVIDGKQTVEDILDNLNITYKNSCNPDIIKRALNI